MIKRALPGKVVPAQGRWTFTIFLTVEEGRIGPFFWNEIFVSASVAKRKMREIVEDLNLNSEQLEGAGE